MKYRSAFLGLLLSAFALASITLFAPSTFGQEKPRKEQKQEKQEKDDQEPAIKIGTTLINVPVIVTDRYGRFVTGLKQSQFSVREDGVPQRIENFSSTEAPFNVALLIDTSRSTQNKLTTIRKAALTFVKQLLPNDRVMIVSFNERVVFANDFTNSQADLERAIKSLKSSYLTSLYDAIHLTITEKMSKVQGRKAIVVLTDGVDTASKRATFESVLDMVASSDIISYAVQYDTRNDGAPVMKPMFLPGFNFKSSISNFNSRRAGWQQEQEKREEKKKEESKSIINIRQPATSIMGTGSAGTTPGQSNVPGSRPSTSVNSGPHQPLRDRYLIAADFLRALAVQSGARYIRAENIENTTYAFQIIAIELHNQYTITYNPQNEAQDGRFRSIAVGVDQDDLIVRSRLGYRISKPDQAETNQDKR